MVSDFEGPMKGAFEKLERARAGEPLDSFVVAAIGALKGKLDGGALGPVLDMLDAPAATPHPTT